MEPVYFALAVTALATLVCVHVSLAYALWRGDGRGLLAVARFVVLPWTPVAGWRVGHRIRALLWGLCAVGYGIGVAILAR